MIKANTFSTQILDDEFIQYPITVTYDYVIRLFVTQIVAFEYYIDATAKLSKKDLDSIVKDLIKSEEGTQIDFI